MIGRNKGFNGQSRTFHLLFKLYFFKNYFLFSVKKQLLYNINHTLIQMFCQSHLKSIKINQKIIYKLAAKLGSNLLLNNIIYMKIISVIGSGTMGNGIAHTFALSGYVVHMTDISKECLDNGLSTINKNLGRQVSKGLITEDIKQSTLQNIRLFVDMNIAVKDADLIIEAATENQEVKLQIFRELDKFCKPQAILASNTSSISITKIASATGRADRVIGMHFMNPVPIMKLVEVIRGYSTSDAVTESIMNLSVKLNKVPIEVNDYPGFVANRILMPMINEAIYTLYEGVAGVYEIDTVMKLGMAHPMGPLKLADFIGLDICLAILNVLHQGFGNPKYSACPLLLNMVNAGQLGVKAGKGFYDYSKDYKNPVLSEKFRRQ